MSRRGCIHWKSCAIELCILEDESCILGECSEYVDSGYRRPLPRDPETVRAILAEKEKKFRELKSSSAGFRFGEGKAAQKEAQRRRAEIAALKRELSHGSVVGPYT